MEKFVAYYRVSTKKQSLGLDAQKSIVNSFVSKPGRIVLDSFEEKETGTKKRFRPEMQKAINMCKDTGATLLIAKLDRLARNVSFVSSLMDSGVKFKALDLPEANELTIHIFAALAQHEAKIISERTKAALTELKKKGVKLGKPENLTKEARIKGAKASVLKAQLNPNNKRAKAFLRLLKGEGHTLSYMAEELNANGFKTSRNKAFHAKQVSRLLEAC
ncbi:recombinase family protein [uncultured Eudoraea sp.]|uniref:recombinase family protein n=1 Tax=uncultured Eudoraea sp. TaxID=1035614 RepID=UPI00262B3ACC|nr:recombinase family protein [uncultured Eudoraea sp.]